nr:hypothetical protein [Leptospira noguchii]
MYFRLHRWKSRKCCYNCHKPEHGDVKLRIRCEWEYGFEKRGCITLRQLRQVD